jgi:hypothetical protein
VGADDGEGRLEVGGLLRAIGRLFDLVSQPQEHLVVIETTPWDAIARRQAAMSSRTLISVPVVIAPPSARRATADRRENTHKRHSSIPDST